MLFILFQFTYFLWVRSVKTGSVFWATLTALSYFYMVSAWGGYVFIINLIPLHVLTLILIGRYCSKLYIGTFFICFFLFLSCLRNFDLFYLILIIEIIHVFSEKVIFSSAQVLSLKYLLPIQNFMFGKDFNLTVQFFYFQRIRHSIFWDK